MTHAKFVFDREGDDASKAFDFLQHLAAAHEPTRAAADALLGTMFALEAELPDTGDDSRAEIATLNLSGSIDVDLTGDVAAQLIAALGTIARKARAAIRRIEAATERGEFPLPRATGWLVTFDDGQTMEFPLCRRETAHTFADAVDGEVSPILADA